MSSLFAPSYETISRRYYASHLHHVQASHARQLARCHAAHASLIHF